MTTVGSCYFGMLILVPLVILSSSSNPWDKYNYSPESRTVVPVRLYTPSNGSTTSGTCGDIGEWNADGQGTLPAPQLKLECPSGGTIATVAFASFGTPTGSCTSAFARSSCSAANSTSVVESLCVGKASCMVPPSPSSSAQNGPNGQPSPLAALFGDPCPGEAKHFATKITCSNDVAPLAAAPLFPITLKGNGADAVFDFGKEVGGYTTVNFGTVSGTDAEVQFFWSESTFYIETGDHSNGGGGDDGPLTSGTLQTGSTWTASNEHLRGGFRYLRVVLVKDATVEITNVSLVFTAAPNLGSNMRAYKSHFMSSDDLINKIWYGSAYTVQMCSISTTHCRQWPPPATGWHNNASCGIGDVTLTDGAKRDRTIWPGDMGVSTATAFATTGDTDAARFSLETEYLHQSTDGMLPYAGPPVNFFGDHSDTYHLWALVGTRNLFEHTSNMTWMKKYYAQFQLGVNVSVAKIVNGLMVVTDKADWQRCCQGGANIAANAILYHVLNSAAMIATALGEPADATRYTAQAATLRDAINDQLWDEKFGAFMDNPTSTLHPQDGNSIASWFGIVGADHLPTRLASISSYLKTNWGPFGSASPEWNGGKAIGTFPGSMEVFQHFAAGEGARALDLVRLQWGYMLNSPHSTESTFWEGYNVDGTFNFQGIYMSNSHGWAAGPGGAMTQNVLGIRADLAQSAMQIALAVADDASATTPTAFVIAPQPSGLEWCLGRLSFADDHAVDVKWNVTADKDTTTRTFTLNLDLAGAHPSAQGRVELPLRFGPTFGEREFVTNGVEIEIEVDGSVVERRAYSAVEEAATKGMARYSIALPMPLRKSHVYVVRRSV